VAHVRGKTVDPDARSTAKTTKRLITKRGQAYRQKVPTEIHKSTRKRGDTNPAPKEVPNTKVANVGKRQKKKVVPRTTALGWVK